MVEIKKSVDENMWEEDFGFLLWKLESVENFFPCYKTMINKEE